MWKLLIFILVSIQTLTQTSGQETPIITEADWEWLASRTDIRRPNHFNSDNGGTATNVLTPSSVNNERPKHDYNFNVDNLGHVETPKVPLAEWTQSAATHTGNLKILTDVTSSNIRNALHGQHSNVNQNSLLLKNHLINTNAGQSPQVPLALLDLQTNRSKQLVSANLISLSYAGEQTKVSKVASQQRVVNGNAEYTQHSQPSSAPLADWIIPDNSHSLSHRQPPTTAPTQKQNVFNMSSVYSQPQVNGYTIQNSGSRFYNDSHSQGSIPTMMPRQNGLFVNQTNSTFIVYNETRGQMPIVPHTDLESRTNQVQFGSLNGSNHTPVIGIQPGGQPVEETPVSNRNLKRIFFANTPSIDIPHDNDTVIVKQTINATTHMRTRLNCRCVVNNRCARKEACERN